jgi:hypothetical protein
MSDYLFAFPRLAFDILALPVLLALLFTMPVLELSVVGVPVLAFTAGRLAFIGLLALPLFAFSPPQAKVNASIAMPTIPKSFLISPPS